jgi:pimeloyl-ACP methyl ester carboxylesterase
MKVNGVELHLGTGGPADGPAVVLLHGFPLDHRMWKPQFPVLEPKWRVVAPDFRGQGRSEVGDGQFTIEHLVDDLVGILDELKIRRAVLVGLSMGGYVALRAVEREPGRVRALVLADTKAPADGNEAKVKRAAGMKKAKSEGSAAFADGFLKAALSPATLRDRPELVESARKMMEGCTPLGIAGTLLALAARGDMTESLAKVRVPAMVVCGEHDAITPPDDSRAMAAALKCRFESIPGAGHLSSMENPEAFNRLLVAFLDGLPAD